MPFATIQTPGKLLTPLHSASERAAWERLQAIQRQWLRTPEHFLVLSVFIGGQFAFSPAPLRRLRPFGPSGQSTLACNMVLGEVALRNGNIADAAQYLIASGKSSGSPALDSFGPNLSLAKALLEVDVVLKFFDLCKAFWGPGALHSLGGLPVRVEIYRAV